jgi:hypothetical protein
MKRLATVAQIVASFVLCACTVLLCGGCERGCLMKEARERGVVPSSSVQTPTSRGTDCVPDLWRCREGNVERSVAGFVPEPCEGPTERCTCPWQRALMCPKGCADQSSDALETVLINDAGAAQLCADEPAAIIGGAVPDGIACEDEGEVVCAKSVVVRCERPPRLVATCTHGCAVSSLPQNVRDREAIMIACLRDGTR